MAITRASGLASNVAAAVNTVFSSGTQVPMPTEMGGEKFTMSIPTGYASGYFTSFFDKGQTHAHTKANQSTYSDAHEVLEGRAISGAPDPVNMFDGRCVHLLNGGATTVTSKSTQFAHVDVGRDLSTLVCPGLTRSAARRSIPASRGISWKAP